MTPATASPVLTDPSPSDADAPVESVPTGDLLVDDDGWLSPDERDDLDALQADAMERDEHGVIIDDRAEWLVKPRSPDDPGSPPPADILNERWDDFVAEVQHRDWRSMLFADEPAATARDIAVHVANHGGAVAR